MITIASRTRTATTISGADIYSTSSQTDGIDGDDAGGNDAARTTRTVLRRSVTITGVVAGKGLPSSVMAGQSSPAILT
jgi:hypothetical protein